MSLLFSPLIWQVATSHFLPAHATVLFVVIGILLLLNAILSGAKVAFFTLKAKDLNYLKTKDSHNTRQAIKLLEQPRLLFASIIAAHTFLNIAIVVCTHLLAIEVLPHNMGAALAMTIEVLVVTLLIVLLGIIIPRVYAIQNNVRMALFAAPILTFIKAMFKPAARLLVSSSSYLEDKIADEKTVLQGNELESTIQKTLGQEPTQEELAIFKGIIGFGEVRAKQVMTPRLDVSGIESSANFVHVRNKILEKGLSRMPVYTHGLDKITGVLNAKDLLPHLNEENFEWQTVIRPVLFVPEDKSVGELLKEFQREKKQIAIVVDEFGGTSGIVTMEDIIEEILGDIKDEFDKDQNYYKPTGDKTAILDGRMSIANLIRINGWPHDKFEKARGSSDTIAGMLTEYLSRFPQEQETITIDNCAFTVLEMDHTRVASVQLKILD